MARRRSAVALALLVVVSGLAAVRPVSGAATCVTTPSGGAPPAAAGGFVAIDPLRVLDTRAAGGTALTDGCTIAIGLPSAPDGASAVALTVTATASAAAGYVTVFACADARPLASNLNPRPGAVVANLAVVRVGSGGDSRVCAHSSVTTDLVVDVLGWFAPGGAPYHPLDGSRAVDTRAGGGSLVPAGTVMRVPSGAPAGATAVAINLTVVDAVADGYAVAFPCGAVPPTSTVPVRAGSAATAAHSYVALASRGELCVRTSVPAHIVVDVAGWFGPGGDASPGQPLVARTPRRLVDTREHRPVVAGRPFRIDALASDALAPHATTVVLDVVATGASDDGWVVLHPCGHAAPATSSLNPSRDHDVTNAVTVALGDDGNVCGVSSVTTHLVVDALASFAAPAALVELRAGGDAALSPPFDPAGLDYAVRCPASGALDVPLTAVSVPGSTVTIDGGAPGRTAAAVARLVAGDLVTVRVARGATTLAVYGIRCLPHDFPIVRTTTRSTPTPGWYLAANTFGPSTARFVYVLDDRGAVVWYRRTSTPVLDVKLLPNGNLAWAPFLAGNQGFGVDPTTVYVEQALDGTQVRSWSAVAAATDHHDLVALANGNVLVLTYERESGVALPGGPACENGARDVWWSTIEEITPQGAVAWRWRSRDHLTPADTTYLPVLPIAGCDLQHAVALDVTSDGDVIATMRHLDAVLRIRRNPGGGDDGQIVWRVGGSATSFVFLDDPYAGPARPHDARLAADGTLSMIDNRTDRPGETARAVVYRLDPVARTARLVWSAPFVAPGTGQTWSGGLGSLRRQPDGHTVIGWGDQSSPQLTEHDADGRVVLAVETPGSWGYRVVKVPASALDRETLRATSGRGP